MTGTLRSAWDNGGTRRAIWSVVPPGGNGTMIRMGLDGHVCIAAGPDALSRPAKPSAKTASAVPALRIGISWPSSSTPATCTSFGCLNAWDELSPKFNRVVQRVEAANEERVDSKSVVFEDGLGDLFGRADETRRIAERAGRPRNRHP